MNRFETLRLAHSSTVDRVAGELRRALFDGEVEAGTPLREVALAGALGVSRSTIREALGALVAEGLATHAPRRGVHVAAADPDSVHDVTAARLVLEVAGVRRWTAAGEEARESCRQALRDFTTASVQGASPAELTAAHLAIHRSFVGLTGSVRLVGLADSLTSETRLALARVDRVHRSAREQVHPHADLLDLLGAGDVDGAVHELEHHLAHDESWMLSALWTDLARSVT